jgi:glyoxylase-like metal-dependent hydrolase (beta-lactamase superfamily II)
MTSFKFPGFIALLCLFGSQVWAGTLLKVQPVTEGVYAIVGDLGNRSPENLGNNATFGVVVTNEGVVLIDAGGTQAGARAIDEVIDTITKQPVVKVINSGGQDHRWLGNDYFRNQGAEIIASKDAVADQKKRTTDQLFVLSNLVSEDIAKSTSPAYADITFDNEFRFELGGVVFEIYHQGAAHTPGDSFIWLPQKSVMFTGDIVYVERMLGVLEHSSSKNWIDVFEAMAAFKPEFIVPGHGNVTDLDKAEADTYQYLVELRSAVADFMDGGGDISEIGTVELLKYTYLQNYDLLAGRNAQQVYIELEWE